MRGSRGVEMKRGVIVVIAVAIRIGSMFVRGRESAAGCWGVHDSREYFGIVFEVGTATPTRSSLG